MRHSETLITDDGARMITEAANVAISGNRSETHESHERKITAPQWPAPLADEAYYGAAGDLVQAIYPHTETDLPPLLTQTLVAFGNAIGRGPYVQVEATRHFTNLYAAIAGRTSKSRKGTSLGHVRRIFRMLDEDWERRRTEDGLSTGEGLIWAVRDPIYKGEKLEDPGVNDKRLMVFEQEFAQVLTVCMRKQNTLSMTIRKGWDDGSLGTLTKNSPVRATDAHISIVGHITVEELRRKLVATEAFNGFANRFLWVCTTRSKLLPTGGNIDSVDLGPIFQSLSDSMAFAREVGRVIPDQAARGLWIQVYPSLSQERSGLFGAATGRIEAQALRVAMIYALLDRSRIIRLPHLKAALAICSYVEESARFLFGDALGDPIADDLLAALRERPDGMTRTDIREYFQRHRSSEEISRALEVLALAGLARSKSEETPGRSAERWFACTASAR